MAEYPRGIIFAELLQHSATSDAEGAQAMEDRSRKARPLGDIGIGMKRIEVAVLPINKRLVARVVNVTNRSGLRVGTKCGLRWSAEATVRERKWIR